jgi:hypothetical protein
MKIRVNVKESPYRAVGDGQTDDTKAIQRAIDAVHAAGGGEVYFPKGVYRVSIQPETVSDGGWVRALTVYPRITLRGASRESTTIRLADDQSFLLGKVRHKGYGCILGARPFAADCSGLVLKDLCIDNNGPNNGYNALADLDSPDGLWAHQRARASLYLYSARDGVQVASCRFKNTQGVWGICLMGEGGGGTLAIRGAVVINNQWEKNGGGTLDHDNSTLYVAADGARITGNIFTAREATGTVGQRTAIEVHGRDIAVTKNQITGFVSGINIGGSCAYPHERIVASENVIKGAFVGVVLWATKVDDNQPVVLKQTTITKNQIALNINAWQLLKDYKNNYSAGVITAQEGSKDCQIEDLEIAHNTITFTNYAGAERTEGDKYSAGIHYNRAFHSSSNNQTKTLKIHHNTISHAPGMGIYLNAPVTDGEIVENTISHCGTSPAPIWEGFRTGIFCVGKSEQVRLKNNRVTETRTPMQHTTGT